MNRSCGVSGMFAAAIALAIPSVGNAQTESQTGTRFDREKYDHDRGVRDTIQYFGRCVATYKADEIEAFLKVPTAENWRPVVTFPSGRSHCVVRNMSAGFPELRGTIAEAWYRQKYRGGLPVTLAAVPPASQESVIEALTSVPQDDRAEILLDEFAACVAATAPSAVDNFVRTEADSSEETAAMGALSAHLGPCAFAGQRLRLDRISLRAGLAYALARRAAQIPDAE